MSSPFVSLIYLPTSADVPDGAVATTAGWGAIHTYKGNETFVKVDILTKIDVEIYNHDLCQKVFVSRIIYENQICVKGITDTVNVNTVSNFASYEKRAFNLLLKRIQFIETIFCSSGRQWRPFGLQ